jgi:hypothetical protein
MDKKKIMKTNFIFKSAIIFIVLLISYNVRAGEIPPAKNMRYSNNYIIVLDLSDRLLTPHQDVQDIEVIKQVFEKFVHDVQANLIVNSRDRFSVFVLPQTYPSVDYDAFNNVLTLDMSVVPLAKKRMALEEFSKNLDTELETLYRLASVGRRSSDYAGVNLWKFFNEDLNYLLDSQRQNHLIILTDGYLDFEKRTQDELKKHNRYTSTAFLKILKCEDWKEKATTYDYGIIPVTKDHPAAIVTVCGFHPKTNSLCETDKLMFFWKKWLEEMNYNQINLIKKLNRNQLKGMFKRLVY